MSKKSKKKALKKEQRRAEEARRLFLITEIMKVEAQITDRRMTGIGIRRNGYGGIIRKKSAGGYKTD